MGNACFKSWKYDSTASKGGNRNSPVSAGSSFFLSNSCGTGEGWLKTLNQGVWIPFTGVFGQRLEETAVYERRYGEHLAPLVVEQCVAFIRERGLLEVGLFRQPGQATLVKELQVAFDAGEKPTFDSSTDVHTVASLLKLYLRELPEPVVPFSRYQDFLQCGERVPNGRRQALADLKKLLHELPVANFNLLYYICRFLNEVQSYSHINKMSTQNLATVFGPNILRPKAEDPESIIGGAALVQQLMSELIWECGSLFLRDSSGTASGSDSLPRQGQRDDPPEEAPPNPPAARPQSPFPGTAAEGPPQASTPRSLQLPLPALAPRSPLDTFSPRCRAGMEQRPPPHETPSPGNASEPLYDNCPSPSERLSAESGGAPTPAAPPPGPAAVPTLREPLDGCAPGGWGSVGRQSWPMETGSRRSSGGSQDGHRACDDAHESTLSVYDNIDGPARAADDDSEAGTHGGGGAPNPHVAEDGMNSADSSSWSSCEIVLEEKKAAAVPGFGQFTFRTDPEDSQPDFPAASVLPNISLSSACADIFLSPTAPDPLPPLPPHLATSPNAMRYILAGLKQQMARQKEEYEAQIRSLEKRNEALQGEVSSLRSNLEQQRCWYRVVDIKMRNTERALADADRRNLALQQEMEQFFDTFGQLNNEAKKTERILQGF
ncbi:rho GTPase-activating protein 24-like [Megalops cyprinoides]|uniref:rho GTPase-activating protein 24-like n=1 Tax=Megalops cyprinoides TaxID=118141 RepID=UPI0018647FFE|nr:rho GTPase-activating protein 24-like [Megalops cyprinoides]